MSHLQSLLRPSLALLAAILLVSPLAASGGGEPLYEKARARDLPERGKGTLVEAAKLYEEAAKQGSLAAMTRVGVMYVMGIGVGEDEPRGARWLQRAAEAGHAAGMREYGILFAEGWGVDEDDATAVSWYRQAAAAGDGIAMARLGLAYENGEGVEANGKEAKRWFAAAREALEGELGATKDPEVATILGNLHDEGLGGRRGDARAVALYRQAAEAGFVDGQSYLAYMLLAGEGARRDPREAIRWFVRAANQGDVEAMEELARIYLEGDGVAVDGPAYVYWSARAELVELEAEDDPDLPDAEERRLEAELRAQLRAYEALHPEVAPRG
jgi:TPR repeat protein